MKSVTKVTKKTLCALLIALLIIPAFFDYALNLNIAQAAAKIYVVTAPSGLNLRSKASTSSSVISTMKKGTEVRVYAIKGGWAKVMTKNGKRGYCGSNYLAAKGSSGSSDTPVSTPTGKLYFINSVKNINVYRSASTKARRLGQLRGGTVVRLLKSNSTWGYIEVYNTGKRGYIKLDTLKKY